MQGATRIVAFSLFHHGIKPEWEDPANRQGKTLTTRVTLAPAEADETWTRLCVECVRGALDEGVLGVQVSQKSSRHACVLKFDVWLAQTADAARVKRLVAQMLPVLQLEVAPRR